MPKSAVDHTRPRWADTLDGLRMCLKYWWQTVWTAFLGMLIGIVPGFWAAISLLVLWGLTFAVMMPVRQAFLNGLITSENRATVLSFDSLLGSGGGVVIQPVLGKAADAWGYPASYLASAAIQALAIPFAWLARRERAAADPIPARRMHKTR